MHEKWWLLNDATTHNNFRAFLKISSDKYEEEDDDEEGFDWGNWEQQTLTMDFFLSCIRLPKIISHPFTSKKKSLQGVPELRVFKF